MDTRPVQLVNDFVSEFCGGRWELLKTFDFKDLISSGKFGCPGRNFDCDDTNIIRAIYVLLWQDVFPDLNMDNFGYLRQYRGDTMNTFHTMFGRELSNRPGFFAGLEKYSPSDELRQKVRDFSKFYTSLGNYLVLPNCFASSTTLNCYRGTNAWHDFFDRFLIELHKVLTSGSGQDETLSELVKANRFCFDNFTGQENFSNLIEALYLSDYCDGSGLPNLIFSLNYHWKNEADREQYFRDAELYLEKAASIIRRRADRMVARLKMLCS
jgi:hypothetical protein